MQVPTSRRRRRLLLTATAAGLVAAAVVVSTASAAIVPTTEDAAGAATLAAAMTANPANVTGASFQTVPPSNNPNGISDGPLSGFPTNGTTFSILTSGCVELADDANTSGSSGCNDGGGSPAGRGDTARDVTVLVVNVLVPTGSNCLSLDFKFFSDEYPEYVGTQYNDAFIAELDSSTWTTSGSTISAPNNFAFDPSNNVISINSTGATAMSSANASGTTYDGATPTLTASTPVTAGAHTLYLSIFDQGDNFYDSAVFLDNLRIGVAGPNGCQQGAQPKEICNDGIDNDGDGLIDSADPDCDTTKPSCFISAKIAGPPTQLQVTARDQGSGLASIVVTKSINADTVVPPFTVGTTDPVVVTATKIDQSKGSTIELRVTDVAGNVTVCDPVVTLSVRDAGEPATQTYTNIPENESKITIVNGSPGVNRLDVTVNGTTWKLTGLKANQELALDVASAMRRGDNTITLAAYGRPQGSVLVVISD